MAEYDVVVIGGGISGLSMAHFLADSGLKTGVLEKESRSGGAIHTFRGPGDFWMELGAHTAYNSYGRLLKLMDGPGLTAQGLSREKLPWRIWDAGEVVSIASRLKLGEVALGLPRLFFMSRTGHTVAEYYGKVVGPRNYEAVVGPMLTAMSSQDPGAFPAPMLFKKRPRRKDVLRSFTLPGGLQSLTDALAGSARITVLNGVTASEVRAVERGHEIRSLDGLVIHTRGLALATPNAVSARLLESSYPDLARVLGRIRSHAFDSVGVVARREEVRLPRFAGLIALNEPFYSVVSRDVVAHPDLRGFVFHFRPGVSAEHARNRIAEVLGLPVEKWVHHATRHNVLPSPDRNHPALLAELDTWLKGLPLAISGNYFAGLALEDCVQRSESEALRLSGLLKAGA